MSSTTRIVDGFVRVAAEIRKKPTHDDFAERIDDLTEYLENSLSAFQQEVAENYLSVFKPHKFTSHSDVYIPSTPTPNTIVNWTGSFFSVSTKASLGIQDVLVSGTNIKTINSASLLGTGDIVISPFPGFGITHVLAAYGDHTHAGIYQPVSTVLTNTTASFTSTLETKLNEIATGATNVTNNNQLTNGAGYITSQVSHADVLVDGDFASQGIMLRGATAGVYSILTDNSANWNTAFGWGNHASGGYAASGHSHSGVYEPILGNPATNGYVLSSTTTGTRSWIASGGGTTNHASLSNLTYAASGHTGFAALAGSASQEFATANLSVTGTISASSTITGSEVYRGSSRTLKKNIVDFDFDALVFLNDVSIKSYNLKSNNLFGIGFIAEDTHPWLSGDDQKSHSFGNHLGILTKAIQEEDLKIVELQNKVLELENQVKELQNG